MSWEHVVTQNAHFGPTYGHAMHRALNVVYAAHTSHHITHMRMVFVGQHLSTLSLSLSGWLQTRMARGSCSTWQLMEIDSITQYEYIDNDNEDASNTAPYLWLVTSSSPSNVSKRMVRVWSALCLGGGRLWGWTIVDRSYARHAWSMLQNYQYINHKFVRKC